MSGDASANEVIDLESMVKDLSSAPGASQLAADQLDSILFKEAPEMAESQNELRKNQISPDQSPAETVEEGPPTLDQELAPDTWKARIHHRLAFARLKVKHALILLRAAFSRGASDFRGLLIELSIGIKARAKLALARQTENLRQTRIAIQEMSWKGRLLLLISVFVFASAGALASWLYKRGGQFERSVPWVSSVVPLASEVLKGSELSEVEDFYDPLHYPEFTVVVERIVVNLKRDEDETGAVLPMAAFELYLQTENQEAAIEVKNRMVEIRDEISREAESFTRLNLVSDIGKERLKTRIRKAVNDRMQTGRVRKVYFRTFVLSSSSVGSEEETENMDRQTGE